MDGGWILVHKKMRQWKWYQDSETVHLFIHLLLMANYHEKDNLKCGQLRTSFRKLSKETGISVRAIRTRINRLKESKVIDTETTQSNQVITICKYKHFQKPQNDDRSETDTLRGSIPIRRKKKRKRLCPKDFPITDKMKKYSASKKHYPNLKNLTEKFLLYHRAKGSKFVSWYAAWQNWFLNDIKFNGPVDNRPMEERFANK